MVENTKQKEVFIINDIDMEINPSDIQVMDDNWVMEESFLRSKAVFCYRSKYSATKVVLNIPFQISYLNEDNKVNLNNTYNCIKLISQLNSYPFCFIKNNRIKSYISPTSLSVTDFMLFVVDEIAVVQDAQASNMVFLEIILQYYNHVPLIRDFEFRSNLNVALNESGLPFKDSVAPLVVNSLKESEVWKQYTLPRVTKVFENLTKTGLLNYVEPNSNKVHPMMGVKLYAPIMSVITEGIENVDDGRYLGEESKVITVTDTSNFDNGSFEELLMTLSQQDFSETNKVFNPEEIQTINSENRLKVVEKKESKVKEEESVYIPDPFAEVAEQYKEQKKIDSDKDKKDKLEPNLLKNSKDVYIDWVGTDLQELAVGINKIEVRKKNKLITHQIGSFKHPVVQYMGAYPLTVSLVLSSTNFEIYQRDEAPVNVFIKQILNVLDYNRNAIPEAEAYNFIKIKSLATHLFDIESFLPSQSVISASSNSQGLENIVYTFHQGDLTSFVEQGKVEASGANSLDSTQEQINDIIIEYLKGIPHELVNIINNSDIKTNVSNAHILQTYKAIIELTKEAMLETSMDRYPHFESIETAIKHISDLKPNNNISRDYIKIDNSYTKALSTFTLYKDYLPEKDNSLPVEVKKEINNNIAVKKYGQLASGVVQNKANAEYEKIAEAKKQNATKLTTLQFHNALIPFMVYVLTTRSNLQSGKDTNLESISFTPSGRFNNLSLSIISKINSGLKEGAIVNRDAFKNKDNDESGERAEQIGEVLDSLVNKYSKKFFGYNIEDLDFEIFSPTPYDRLTDLLIPQIDPFFFLVETQILDGNEFTTIYEKMYKNTKYNPNLLENLNNRDGVDTDEVDSTQEKFEVQYRKLEEIDYQPLDTTSETSTPVGLLSQAQMGILPSSSSGPAIAKKMDPAISQAIEKALKKYGKQNDEGFRRYMYAVLLSESSNKNSQRSGTGAVGLFQATEDYVEDLVKNPKNQLEYSNGSKVGVGSSKTFVRQVKAASANDMYLSSQMFIEYYQKFNKTSGVVDPIQAYMKHNIGSGGESSVNAVLSGRSFKLSAAALKAIRNQGKGKFIRENDVQTARAYADFVRRKMSVDNVPDYVTTKDKFNATEISKNIVKNIDFDSISFKKQQEKVELMSKDYKEATITKTDKTSSQTISPSTIKGVVSNVIDGDTVTVRSTNGKEYRVRLYGLDSPESVNKENKEIGGKLAAQTLNSLLSGKNVSVQLSGKDKYNRDIGIVTLKDGTNPSLVMLRNGNAFLAEGFTNIGDYAKAEEEAKKAQKGLWSYPDNIITKPRAPASGRVDYTGINNTQANLIKNNTNPISFTSKDLIRAKQVGGNKLNTFQPFLGGQKFVITSTFGPRTPPKKGASPYHKGVDLSSPIGTVVVASASGIVTIARVGTGYGNYIEINHGNGFSTRYAHLSKMVVKVGDKVQYLQKIGESGNTGISTNPHLHYEVRYKGEAINPFGTKELNLYKGDSLASGQMENLSSGSVGGGDYYNSSNTVLGQKPEGLVRNRPGVTEENTVFNEDKLADAIFENIYKNTNVGLKSSIPSIKVYMTIGNENDKLWLDTIKGDVLYYEIKGVKSFKMNCNNDANPVDTGILTIADPSFLNTDNFSGISKMQGVNVNAIGTSEEIQFKNNRIQLKIGNKLQIKLGYGNSPNDLETVFNGSIADLQVNQQTLTLMLEGYGKELVNEILSPHKPSFLNEQADNISTSSVIGESLFAENIEHFGFSSGYWANKFRRETDPESKALAPGRFSFSYNWGYDFTPAQFKSRLFINVFSPEIETIDDEFKKYWSGFSVIATMFTNHAAGYPFAVYRMTPWQCMKQMEYRHPNTICKPMWYEDRMTLFYGIKEQMYFKKELNKPLQRSAALQKEDGLGYDLSSYYDSRRERMAPVSNIHLVTSSNNLISNGLRINSSYATRVRVTYSDSDVLTDASEITKPWKLETFEANADDNLYPFDIRTKELSLSGCLSRYSSFLYGTTELKKEAEKMYGGSIRILGNPTLKAGDYIFLDDADKRMNGLVLVRECYHHFDDKVGFITEIVPGQYVEAANFMYSSLWLNLICSCKIVSSKMRTILGSNYSSEDFDMVSSFLTVLRQAELEMDTINKGENSTELKVIYASVVGLSAYLINSLAKTMGINNRNSLFKSLGITSSAGVWGFNKNMYKILATDTDIKIKKRIQEKIKNLNSSSRNRLNILLDKGKIDWKGLAAQPRQILASNTYVQALKERISAKNSSLIWKGTSKLMSLGSKATLEAAKIVVRATYSIALAVTFTNPITILLDIVLYAAIQYGFAKIEENNLMRQPLLYFPLLRHGKPYVGGMAGMVRNSWIDSQKLEVGKTYKELQKAANVLIGNNDVTNLSHDKPFYVSLLEGAAVSNGQKVITPLKQTDSEGSPIVIKDNTIMTKKESLILDEKRYQSYLKDEEVLKRKLIQKTNQQSIGNVTNEP